MLPDGIPGDGDQGSGLRDGEQQRTGLNLEPVLRHPAGPRWQIAARNEGAYLLRKATHPSGMREHLSFDKDVLMLAIRGDEAYATLKRGIKTRNYRYPTKEEPRFSSNRLFPKVNPRFKLLSGQKVFTIGSCFAREVERSLHWLGFDIPMLRYICPDNEFPWPGPHLLNEYNAGTMFQRINNTYGKFEYSEFAGVEETEGGYLDLLLHINQSPVPLQRLHERRIEIASTYNEMKSSEVVVLTLGLTESWYDSETKCYLNKAPSRKFVSDHPGRFFFHRMDLEDIVPLISASVEAIRGDGDKHVLITVSPIPIEATFTEQDAIIANYYSKSTLRVAAQLMKEKFDNVEYFPSYEIAMSGGALSFTADNVHVEHETVDVIMNYLVRNFVSEGNSDEENGHLHTDIDAEVGQRANF